MSAKKEYETKLDEKDTFDSGIVSGEIFSGPCDDAGDSGVICEDATCGLPNLEEQMTRITLNEKCFPDLPPLEILFRPDGDGDTQLHIASVHGCEKSVGTIIRVCPEKGWLDIPNDYGHTPLHLAVMSGNPVVTRMLVIAGASLAIRDFMGETPLHKATVARNLECINALLKPVSDVSNRKSLSSVLEQRNYNGQCCIHLAASAGSVETLKTLLYYGADISARENLAGWTALHIAARRGHLRVVQYLRERCSGAELRLTDYAGRTPKRLARFTKAKAAFANSKDDSDSESDSEDDYDSDSETIFEELRESMSKSINVA